MTILNETLLFAAAAAGGGLLGAAALWMIQRIKLTHFTQLANSLIRKGEAEAETIKKNAKFPLIKGKWNSNGNSNGVGNRKKSASK